MKGGGYKPKSGRRNPATGAIDTASPKVRALAKTYQDHHWGSKADRLIHVKDTCVPDVVAMGRMEQLQGRFGNIDFPQGCWLAWNPKHPLERLYIILSDSMRERVRKLMKDVSPQQTEYLQDIAQRAGGAQSAHKLPHIKAIDLGKSTAICYRTHKAGDGWSSYIHEWGHEGGGGLLPHIALDVSGRCWVVGGNMRVKEAGIIR